MIRGRRGGGGRRGGRCDGISHLLCESEARGGLINVSTLKFPSYTGQWQCKLCATCASCGSGTPGPDNNHGGVQGCWRHEVGGGMELRSGIIGKWKWNYGEGGMELQEREGGMEL